MIAFCWAAVGSSNGSSDGGGLDTEDTSHLVGLAATLGAFPVAVRVGGDLEGGVAEVAAEPGDRAAGFERALGERVAEAVEGAFLAGRAFAWDAGAAHRGVED